MAAPDASDWTRDVLDFWFGLTDEQHWQPDPALDAAITDRFGDLWEAQRAHAPDHFLADADTALAAIILFDQFPRNMFREDPRSFATDELARGIASGTLDRGFDRAVPEERRHFFYMPFEHSEDLADQDRSVALFEATGNAHFLDFAVKHRDVIARFGRFPHRNRVLGRASTPEEEAFGLEPPW